MVGLFKAIKALTSTASAARVAPNAASNAQRKPVLIRATGPCAALTLCYTSQEALGLDADLAWRDSNREADRAATSCPAEWKSTDRGFSGQPAASAGVLSLSRR